MNVRTVRCAQSALATDEYSSSIDIKRSVCSCAVGTFGGSSPGFLLFLLSALTSLSVAPKPRPEVRWRNSIGSTSLQQEEDYTPTD